MNFTGFRPWVARLVRKGITLKYLQSLQDILLDQEYNILKTELENRIVRDEALERKNWLAKMDKNGFHNETHIHRDTGFFLNENRFDWKGDHYDTKTKWCPRGFTMGGVHKDTGTEWDTFDFGQNGVHKETGTGRNHRGFCQDGQIWVCDDQGYEGWSNTDYYGFYITGIHKETGTKWDKYGFDLNGNHNVTQTEINPNGFSRDGYHYETYSKFGPDGFDRDDVNEDGFYRNGIHSYTGTRFNMHKRDINGFYPNGLHYRTKSLFGPSGKTCEGLRHGPSGFGLDQTRLAIRSHILLLRG